MPVSDTHPQYNKAAPKWAKVRDCAEGAEAVKKGKSKYLPEPEGSGDDPNRYDRYIERAQFANFVGSTVSGLSGLVFRKDVVIDLPQSIEYLKENANGGGVSLEQCIRKAMREMLQPGRFGLLVDYPKAPKGITKAQEDALNLQANILMYKAEDIINWRTTRVGGVDKLSLVVLAEKKEVVADDGFGVETKDYHRVLMLNGDGIYIQRLYNDKDELIADDSGETDIVPLDANGSPFNDIQFFFCGSENNDPDVDGIPLLDIANLNIGHYRNSADYEDSCYLVGQPTPWAAGISQTWADTILKNGIKIGSRAFLLLPEGGSAGLMQAAPNSMPLEAMREKESQMVKLGARIISDQAGNETAEAARIRFAGQTSKLAGMVGNIEDVFESASESAMRFMGGTGEPEIEINREFYEKKADPQMVMAQIALLDRGVVASNDVRDYLRDHGVVDGARTDEEMDAESEEGVMGDDYANP